MKINFCQHISSPLTLSSGKRLYPNVNKSLIIAGVAFCSFFSLGIAYGIFLTVTYKKKINISDLTASSKTSSSTTSVKETVFYLNDAPIVANLKKQGFLPPIERGANGSCLFLSVAPQITQEDLDYLDDSMLKDWNSSTEQEKADLLRMLAMRAESQFICSLNDGILNEEDVDWINELYKDMLQEIEKLNFSDTRERSKAASAEEKLEFCKAHFSEYKKRTKKTYKWAGTSELIGIGRTFNRKVIAYGRDLAQSKKVLVNAKKEIQPYYESPTGELPPIYVFQCSGGGHYRQLAKASSI